ncbi:malonate--CoA ligase [Arsenicitalea aurantiaca]|uniref:malonate--CoA ligase n=1 Tax=Arsenicitalea aurantiaca TaxID=1783274 RepID=UPI001FCEBE68|nr:malonyl-CoA synthase [Arsenicitalea aurantiaca]
MERIAHSGDVLFATTPEGRRLSYAGLWARAGQYANLLRRAGARPGDRCAVQVEKSLEVLALYLGCLRAGVAYLPLNSAYTPAEIGYFLGDAEPVVFVCDPARRDAFAALAAEKGVGHLLTLGAAGEGSLAAGADAEPAEGIDHRAAPDDLAAILYTSGTTGRSKGVMLSRHNLYSNAETLHRAWRFTRDDVLLHALPLFHTHGLFVATNITLLAGASMIMLARFEPGEVLAALPGATVMMGVPTYYTRLLAHPGLTGEAVSHMRLFVSGSAPLSAQTHRDWRERTGHAILERYGMTETNMNVSNPYEGERRPGTVGFPLEGVQVRIADRETGAELPRGEVGSIEVKGPNVFSGYWRAPEKTRSEFREDGYFITGDLGVQDEDGYISIVGRGKDLVISGGLNVYPAEVEMVLDTLPGIQSSAIIGVPHPDFGEAVVAVVSARPGAEVDEAATRRALSGVLANFKVPKRVIVVPELPYNTMGKVQKNELRNRYQGLFVEGTAGA